MHPAEFQKKWIGVTLKERSAAQEHFIDLRHVLGVPTPAAADPDGTFYTFERGAKNSTGGDGWADVWYRQHFAREYKGKRAVWAAYGWDDPDPATVDEDTILSRLLALNMNRFAEH